MRRHLLAAACLLVAGAARAHDAPHVEIARLDARIDASPGDVDLYVERAVLHRREGHHERALLDLGMAELLDPFRRDIRLERGLTRAALGEAAAAEADLTAFLAAGPPSAIALAARGRLREAAKSLDPARADYDAAVKLGADPEIWLARGRVDEALGQIDRAIAGYDEGKRALGGAVVLRIALVRALRARGHLDRAIVELDELAAMSPAKATFLLQRADVQAAAKRPAAAARDRALAIAELDAAIARRPTDLARMTRAKAYLAVGRTADAVRELEAVVARAPSLAEARALLDEARRRGRKGSP